MSLTSRIEIVECLDEDIPKCAEIFSLSFGHDAPFVNAYFPQHDTEAGQAQMRRRLLEWKQSPDDAKSLKAVLRGNSDEVDENIGVAIWTHMMEAPSKNLDEVEDTERGWVDENDREYMRRLWRGYVGPRGQAVNESGGAGVYVLELLVVHPAHQRKGAGTTLSRWGTDVADQKGLECVVESSPAGMKTYQNCGFYTTIEVIEFDVGPEFAHKPPAIVPFLRRPAKSSQ